jgi:hypothetical protein
MNRCVASTLATCALSLLATTSRAAPTPPDGSPPPADPPVAPEPQPVVVVDHPQLTTGGLTQLSDTLARVEVAGSTRGVAEDFLVLPDGAELGGRLRMVTADEGLGVGRIKLTDLALLDVNAQWAFARGFELDGTFSVLPKQPSATREHVWQGGSLAVRHDLWTRTAVAVSGSTAPLLGLPGFELGAAAFLMHKHRLNEFVSFALAGGASSTFLRPEMTDDQPYLFEGAGHAAVHVAFDHMWGGWMGAGYALPVFHRGHDPVSAMSLDPQPRLDLNLGTAIQLADKWDLSIELTIIDRGDGANPATRLPILDGGFDQIQLGVGISRRLDLGKDSRRPRGINDPMINL